VFVIASLFASVTFGVLTQSLVTLGSPWYVWAIAAIGFGAILVSEIEEVLAGGILFSLFSGYITIVTSDWPGLIVIVASWGLFLTTEYLRSRYM
jgi:hypothetical protein